MGDNDNNEDNDLNSPEEGQFTDCAPHFIASEDNRSSIQGSNRTSVYDSNRMSVHEGNRKLAYEGNRTSIHENIHQISHESSNIHESKPRASHESNRPVDPEEDHPEGLQDIRAYYATATNGSGENKSTRNSVAEQHIPETDLKLPSPTLDVNVDAISQEFNTAPKPQQTSQHLLAIPNVNQGPNSHYRRERYRSSSSSVDFSFHPKLLDRDLFGRLDDDRDSRYGPCGVSSGSMRTVLENTGMHPSGSTDTISKNSNSHNTGDQPNAKLRFYPFSRYKVTGQYPYPSWGPEEDVPVKFNSIEAIFNNIAKKFGFQKDSVKNMTEHLMTMLDSRASRYKPQVALDTLHADYIGGDNSNYRKWYFASQMDVYDLTEEQKNAAKDIGDEQEQLERNEEKWLLRMQSLTNEEKVRDLALYLMLWGEAAQVRYTPEALCFLYKTASDYYCHSGNEKPDVEEGTYLDTVIRPLFEFFRNQGYVMKFGRYMKRERDHDKIIGYDDVNQFFWHSSFYDKIYLSDDKKNTLGKLPPHERYDALKNVNWAKTFKKTYKEKRTWMHASVNFSRVWVIHIVTFWYYITANAYSLYLNPEKEIADQEVSVQISIVALGGMIACLLVLIGSFSELSYLPFTWTKSKCLFRRIIFLFLLMIINAGPSYYCVYMDRISWKSKTVAVIQLFVSIATTLYLAIVPPARLFKGKLKHTRDDLAHEVFTANFAPLKPIDRVMSVCLWLCVFTCKLLESYFFLALSFKDPLKVISKMDITNCNDKILGTMLCEQMPRITIAIMLLMDLVLYFLDTYLWYITWNTIFSVARSFYLGISIWTPWRSIFARLPQRMFSKLLASPDIHIVEKSRTVCSSIWNSIVVSIYQEHLISAEHAQSMLYTSDPVPDLPYNMKAPNFFITQEDISFKAEYFPRGGEAERRFHFFAQSLTTPMPSAYPVQSMPTFTVLTPHYGEKILLSLREIIKEEDDSTRVTLLEYLKQLHAAEWENFVKDTKVRVSDVEKNASGLLDPSGSHAETASTLIGSNNNSSVNLPVDGNVKKVPKYDDLPFYCLGFKDSKPEYKLRTRIWASLRAQTLYRTISGFMNYRKAIRVLFKVENFGDTVNYEGDQDALERDMNTLVNSKFKFVVAMQRYAKFTKTEVEDTEIVLKAFPDLRIAYIDEDPPREEGGEPIYYSALIDGHAELLSTGKRKPYFRIRLPGNPILGDGKSDNQNHAIIFYRGEFLQLVDANQDNYLEECYKICNVLNEFEVSDTLQVSPYSSHYPKNNKHPVSIVGAREYIFSENTGVLGDVAAGKEQTFGTLTQRIMAKSGGKLHYGHPDFLNAIYMNTRGGVSKAQKGLHLNEDIYAGMNSFTRGGRIKHTEYFQCGKGRDLGFGSILNFTTKIGTGMGEQMLSREYYYIGTQLPLDRFLTFYYAHPGFHLNNIFIMLSVQMFMLAVLFISAMGHSLTICEYNPDLPEDTPLTPEGCYNIVPIFDWVKRCIISIIAVFLVAFLPLFLQELTEKGIWRSLTRMAKHFACLSPLFEIFVTQIYTNSVLENLVYGGARYIGTGRGFATSRIPFSTLYSRFTGPSIYVGARNFLIMLFASLAYWIPHLVYFWFTVIALIVSPFIFNPNQFAPLEFLLDYKAFIRWMSRGNSKTHPNSWISHIRSSRARITGYKRSKENDATKGIADVPRANRYAMIISEVIFPLIHAVLCTIPYAFAKSFDPTDRTLPSTGPSGLIRIGVLSFAPIILNIVGIVAFFGMSIAIGSILSLWVTKFGSFMGALAHGWAVLSMIIIFEVLFILEHWNFTNVVLAIIAMSSIQRFFIKFLTVAFLTREFKHDEANRGWWTGKWYGRELGWHGKIEYDIE
ncbi:Putative 1,3-beta-glucan synthase [Rhizopus microsporus]|nr:Putative 1,3-beta-glucan synthase [Rhizopus microsporus]